MATAQKQSVLRDKGEAENALRAVKAERTAVKPRKVYLAHERKLSDAPMQPAYMVTTDAAVLMGLTLGEQMPNKKWHKANEQFEGHDVYIYDKPGFTERFFDVPPERIFEADHFSAEIEGAG